MGVFLVLEASRPSGLLPSRFRVLSAPASGFGDSRTSTAVLKMGHLERGALSQFNSIRSNPSLHKKQGDAY